jgi:ApbE superfamily uncharacterized protein (UPF0280 family)
MSVTLTKAISFSLTQRSARENDRAATALCHDQGSLGNDRLQGMIWKNLPRT